MLDNASNDNNSERKLEKTGSSLVGKFLVASPLMTDSKYQKSVIYICAHNEEGAMGIEINKLYGSMSLTTLLSQLNIQENKLAQDLPIFAGGPNETSRGFVLHSSETNYESTISIDPTISLTATMDILKEIADGKGPKENLLALGYIGWSKGQLDRELQEHGWLVSNSDNGLLFDHDFGNKWLKALNKIGIREVSMIAAEGGIA